MALKQRFASKANSLRQEISIDPAPCAFLALVASAVIGIAGGAGMDAFKPLEQSSHIKKGVALEQYHELMTDINSTKEQLTASIGDNYNMPDYLHKYTEVNKDDDDASKRYNELDTKYKSMVFDFIASIHEDRRIDEVDARDLLEELQEEHGSITEFTTLYHELDYNDLFEARSNAHTYQLEDINQAAADNNDIKTGFFIFGGTALAQFFCALILLALREPLTRLARGESKSKPKKKYGH